MFHCKIALYGGLGGDEVAPLEALFARVVEPVGVVGAAAPAQRRLVGRLIGRPVSGHRDRARRLLLTLEFYHCNSTALLLTT